MRPARLVRLVVLVALLVVPVAQAQVPIDTEVTVLGPDGTETDRLKPGSGGQFRIDVTNRHNTSINATFGPAPARGGYATGPLQPNSSGLVLIPFQVPAGTPEGTRNVTLLGSVQARQDGNWTHLGNTSINVTFRVVHPTPPPTFPVVPVTIVAAAVGLAGAALYLRLQKPDQELPPEPTEQEVQRGIEERRQSITEAKRRDIQESIDRARDRFESGEITEYQFERIKERKEDQLRELEDDDDGA